ncbi:trans-sialidase, putative, partial [Trypanosoma cruzi]
MNEHHAPGHESPFKKVTSQGVERCESRRPLRFSPNDVKLTLRDLSGNNTVRVCVSCVLLLLLGLYLGDGSL